MKQLIVSLHLILFSILAAFAHSPLKATVPSDKAKLATAPTAIQLTFGKAARLTKVTLTHNPTGSAEMKKLALPSKKFGTVFEFQPSFSGAGLYQVDWRALSKDGHALKGKFSFSIVE